VRTRPPLPRACGGKRQEEAPSACGWLSLWTTPIFLQISPAADTLASMKGPRIRRSTRWGG
jgi:hypothetical protein